MDILERLGLIVDGYYTHGTIPKLAHDSQKEIIRLRKIEAAAVAWRAEINSANESARIYKALLKLLSVLPEE